jgi:hypothetical protein
MWTMLRGMCSTLCAPWNVAFASLVVHHVTWHVQHLCDKWTMSLARYVISAERQLASRAPRFVINAAAHVALRAALCVS